MEQDFHNWIPDRNPFNLPKPPVWWLTRLHDQDEALVLFPSRTRVNTYVLARRRQFSKAAHAKFDGHVVRPRTGGDNDVVADHNLIYVAHVVGGIAHWSETIFKQLKEGDTWAQGGADALIQKLEDAEAAAEGKKRKGLLDMFDHMARDAWRSFKARTGQRNQRSTSATKVKIVQTNQRL